MIIPLYSGKIMIKSMNTKYSILSNKCDWKSPRLPRDRRVKVTKYSWCLMCPWCCVSVQTNIASNTFYLWLSNTGIEIKQTMDKRGPWATDLLWKQVNPGHLGFSMNNFFWGLCLHFTRFFKVHVFYERHKIRHHFLLVKFYGIFSRFWAIHKKHQL